MLFVSAMRRKRQRRSRKSPRGFRYVSLRRKS